MSFRESLHRVANVTCTAILIAMAMATSASADTQPAPLFTYAIPQGPQGIYSDSWIVGINVAGIQIPATTIVANLPDAPAITVPRLTWYPRCCYIDSPGSPYDQLPDPTQPQENFDWSWLGQGLSITFYHGAVGGYVGQLYQIHSNFRGEILLGRLKPGGGGPDGGPRVAAVPTTGLLPLLALILGVAVVAQRRFATAIRGA